MRKSLWAVTYVALLVQMGSARPPGREQAETPVRNLLLQERALRLLEQASALAKSHSQISDETSSWYAYLRIAQVSAEAGVALRRWDLVRRAEIFESLWGVKDPMVTRAQSAMACEANDAALFGSLVANANPYESELYREAVRQGRGDWVRDALRRVYQGVQGSDEEALMARRSVLSDAWDVADRSGGDPTFYELAIEW